MPGAEQVPVAGRGRGASRRGSTTPRALPRRPGPTPYLVHARSRAGSPTQQSPQSITPVTSSPTTRMCSGPRSPCTSRASGGGAPAAPGAPGPRHAAEPAAAAARRVAIRSRIPWASANDEARVPRTRGDRQVAGPRRAARGGSGPRRGRVRPPCRGSRHRRSERDARRAAPRRRPAAPAQAAGAAVRATASRPPHGVPAAPPRRRRGDRSTHRPSTRVARVSQPLSKSSKSATTGHPTPAGRAATTDVRPRRPLRSAVWTSTR